MDEDALVAGTLRCDRHLKFARFNVLAAEFQAAQTYAVLAQLAAEDFANEHPCPPSLTCYARASAEMARVMLYASRGKQDWLFGYEELQRAIAYRSNFEGDELVDLELLALDYQADGGSPGEAASQCRFMLDAMPGLSPQSRLEIAARAVRFEATAGNVEAASAIAVPTETSLTGEEDPRVLASFYASRAILEFQRERFDAADHYVLQYFAARPYDHGPFWIASYFLIAELELGLGNRDAAAEAFHKGLSVSRRKRFGYYLRDDFRLHLPI